MILFLICFAFVIAGVLALKFMYDGILGAVLISLGALLLSICFLVLIACRAGSTVTAQKVKMERESILKRIDKIDNNYESESTSQVIKDASEFNQDCAEWHYWKDNLWTNWFFSQKVVDEYQPIDIDKALEEKGER